MWLAPPCGLALLRVPIGPYCGRECDGHPVRDGIAYTALNQLAYGYSWLAFPHRHPKKRNWIFLDANTGTMIIGTVSREPGSRAAPPPGWPPGAAMTRYGSRTTGVSYQRSAVLRNCQLGELRRNHQQPRRVTA